jgi:deoxyribonuclease V
MTPPPATPGPFSDRIRAAIALQKQLAAQFSEDGWPADLRFLGGADIAFAKGPDGQRAGSVGSPGIGIAVVWDLRRRRPVDAACARLAVDFPYVPGLLSFREEPLLLAAIRRLRHPVDAWLFDGQGRAHPRGVGLATHMGIRLNAPAVGAAKSILVGRYEIPAALQRLLPPPATSAGRRPARRGPLAPLPAPITAPVLHHGTEIARALWTLPRTEPMIISPGHCCTLDQAVAATLAATLPGQWMPEPTRLADALSKQARNLPPAAAQALVAEHRSRSDIDIF